MASFEEKVEWGQEGGHSWAGGGVWNDGNNAESRCCVCWVLLRCGKEFTRSHWSWERRLSGQRKAHLGSPPLQQSCLRAFSFFTVLPCSIQVKQHCTGLWKNQEWAALRERVSRIQLVQLYGLSLFTHFGLKLLFNIDMYFKRRLQSPKDLPKF